MPPQRSLFVPILISILNVFASLAINNASDEINLPLSGSVLVGLAISCTILYVLLGESSHLSTNQPGTTSWLWFSGLPAIGGALLFFYALPKSQEVSSNFALVVGYTSLILFVTGVILPPSLVTWHRLRISDRLTSPDNATPSLHQQTSFLQPEAPHSPNTPLVESSSQSLSNERAETTPMIRLSSETLQELVELLEPHLRNERQRRACLRLAVGDLPVLRDLEWSGSAVTFITDMIDRLVDYGDISPGRPALGVLLEHIRSKYGPQKQRDIDILWSRIYFIR